MQLLNEVCAELDQSGERAAATPSSLLQEVFQSSLVYLAALLKISERLGFELADIAYETASQAVTVADFHRAFTEGEPGSQRAEGAAVPPA